MILKLRVGGTVAVDRDTANSRCVDTGVQSRRDLIQNLVTGAEQVTIVVPVPNSAAYRGPRRPHPPDRLPLPHHRGWSLPPGGWSFTLQNAR